MKQATATAQGTADAEKQLRAFIAKFDAKDQRLIQAVRKARQADYPIRVRQAASAPQTG
jgi:hypothetical protein